MILEAAQPMDPRAFGERLQRLRIDRGLERHDIFGATRISCRIVAALEAGAFESLPERVFSRSFVRQIAQTVGCDCESLVSDFDRAWELHLIESGEHETLPTVYPAPRRAIRWRFWFPISVCGILVFAVAVVILSGSEPSQAALLEQPRRHLRREAAAADDAVGTREGSPLADPTASPQGPVDLRVIVEPDQECWVRYRDREGRTDQRLVPGGEQLQLRLDGPVKLTVGNASAARLVVDGVEYADLGIPGQVVHAEVSRRGVTALGAGPHHD